VTCSGGGGGSRVDNAHCFAFKQLAMAACLPACLPVVALPM